jgi:hypothetical protein
MPRGDANWITERPQEFRLEGRRWERFRISVAWVTEKHKQIFNPTHLKYRAI